MTCTNTLDFYSKFDDVELAENQVYPCLTLGPFSSSNPQKDLEYLLLPKSSLDQPKAYCYLEPHEKEHFELPLSKNTAVYAMERDLITGRVLKYSHSFSSSSNAKNSLDLAREPGSISDFVRGNATNLPFMPGGITIQQSTTSSIDWEKLSSCPPGFTSGMQFETSSSSLKHLMTNLTLDLVAEITEETKEIVQVATTVQAIDSMLPVEYKPVSVAKPPTLSNKEWAHLIDVNKPFNEFHELVPEMAFEYPFELDVFQKRAVYHLECGDSVFVAAHTSAGKTVVAEYAIALAQKHMTKAIYTSPIKALSNQKFRDFRKTFQDVGILTGDVQINPNATCLIMTTEILRSMLYRGADILRDTEFVIFDECHYVNDAERGVVWEEVIIMLPAHVTIILLSATVPNTREFADWVGRTKQRDIYVVSTLKRPVPLEHFLYSNKDIFKIVDSNKNFITSSFKKFKDQFTVKKQQDKQLYNTLVAILKKKQLLPAIVFSFSKKKCDEYANSLGNLDLTSGSAEKSEIFVFCELSLQRLTGTDRQLPQVLWVKQLLSRGIAVHHAGLLPIIKEMVEILFTRGLIKVLFATETFAMGVNAPAKAVVFTQLRKHDGKSMRDLLPGEYTQMSGRAGRRGLDDTGVVIIVCDRDLPEASDLSRILLGQPMKLESQFRLTYNMILNLLKIEALKIEDLMKKSFSENHSQRLLPDQEKQLIENTAKLGEMQQLECIICVPSIYDYYELCIRYFMLVFDTRARVLASPAGSKALVAGRVVVVNNVFYRNCIAVLVSSGNSVEAMVLYDSENCFYPPTRVYVPCNPQLVKATFAATDILVITTIQLNLQESDVSSSLLEIAIEMNSSQDLKEMEFKIKELEFQEKNTEKLVILQHLLKFQCNSCPDFCSHYSLVHEQELLTRQINDLNLVVSDQNLELLPEYNQRMDVLRIQQFIDASNTVNLKGRVACELNTCDELLVTELVLSNFFSKFDYSEVVALLSCFVFQEKSSVEPSLTSSLQDGIDEIIEKFDELSHVQRSCAVSVGDVTDSLKFGLVQVVYEWSRGMSFKQITDLTDVPEGSIVRCIVRLEETCRELKGAARLIGDPGLFKKMEEAQASIKRDIVFAASLYF